ncbi:MAG: chemotaxis protein CheW [Bacillota bacterium]
MVNQALTIFTIDGEQCALRASEIELVAKISELSIVPAAPPEILGMANFRGRAVVVFDAGALMGKTKTGVRKKIIVFKNNDCAWAIDDVLDVITAPVTVKNLTVGQMAAVGAISEGIIEIEDKHILLCSYDNMNERRVK